LGGIIAGIAFSPDGKTVATAAGGPNCVVLWDIVHRKRISPKNHKLSQELIDEITFSPDGKTIAIGSWCSGRLELWDVASGKCTSELVERGSVPTIAFSTDGKTLFAYKFADGLERWDVSTGKRAKTAIPNLDYRCTGLTRGGKLLATAIDLDKGGDKLQVWDVSTAKELIAINFPRSVSRLLRPANRSANSANKTNVLGSWD
jgi:WD40 repeat protein